MKVTTNTPELLIVEDKPVLIAVFLTAFTLVFVAAGIGVWASGDWWGALIALSGGAFGGLFIAIFVRRVQLVLHRPEGWAEFRRKNLFRQTKVRHALSEISRAEVESSQSSEGGATYRVVLVFDRGESAGRHPVTFAYSTGRGHKICAKAINDWLGTTA